MLARFFAWTGFAAALLFVGSLTVFGHPGTLAMSPAALWQGCSWSETCPAAGDVRTAATPLGQVASAPERPAAR